MWNLWKINIKTLTFGIQGSWKRRKNYLLYVTGNSSTTSSIYQLNHLISFGTDELAHWAESLAMSMIGTTEAFFTILRRFTFQGWLFCTQRNVYSHYITCISAVENIKTEPLYALFSFTALIVKITGSGTFAPGSTDFFF